MSEAKEALKLAARRYAGYGAMLDRAIDTVLSGGVKEHRFVPSGRRIFTVVGRLGDEFIDPEKPYCSCSDFFFRVMSGKADLCYHLLSHKIAADQGRVELVTLHDEEYGQFFAMVVGDVFGVLDRSSGASSLRLP